MTMMALTRKSHRALHLWLLAAGLLLVGVAGASLSRSPVYAIAEGDVQFAIVQSPAGGSTVQVGSTVTFDIAPVVTNAPVNIPLFLEFLTPSGLVYSGSNAPGGITCGLIPTTDDVRCDYGNVVPGPVVQITLSFSITSAVTTAAAQFRVRAGAADGGPDLASTGDDTYTGSGILSVFSSSDFTTAGSGSPSTVFEGSTTTYTATIENTSAVATGSFGSALVFTNGIVTGVTCTTAGPNGASAGTSSPTATCTGSNLAPTETLTITATVAASNTTSGADITASLSVPGLGIAAPISGVSVQEVGLDSTGGTLAVGTPINVCTATVPTDVPDDAAAGSAQPNNGPLLIGQTSLNALLQVADFQVAGPGVGAVSAATGCGANQSGVRFTPSAGGSYSVTALYNTGGSNALTLTVGGANNPLPATSVLVPSTASAGGPQFVLTVTGSNFVASSVVNWNGSPLATTYGSANSLTAIVPAANISAVTVANLTVTNPAPGGGTSSPALSFTVTAAPNPIPAVSSLTPNTTSAGSVQFAIAVAGTNFVAGSSVLWNGVALTTAYLSPTSLTATVPAANVTNPGAANVAVFNPAPGGGTSVTPQTFTITASASKLAFTTQPGSGVAGIALSTQPVVAVQTAANATLTGDSTTSVTLSLNGTGTLTCTGGLTRTVAAGLASFAGCAVSAAGAGFTITAAAAGLTSATSGVFEVTVAPPTASTQVTVSNPSNAPIARSRLTFAVSTGGLDASAVSFIIKRKADGKFFNVATGSWQDAVILNTAADGTGGTWEIDIDGEARREFAGTVVTVEARVTVGATVYVNSAIPDLNIR